MNQPPKSGHAGIQLRAKSGLYRARLRLLGKMHEAGEYVTVEEAVAARAALYAKLIAIKESQE